MIIAQNPFTHQTRVYWEDTDGGGIVYYANYLKFAERARTEWLRTLGFNQSDLARGAAPADPAAGAAGANAVLFVVRHCEITYKKPARLDDVLDVTVAVRHVTKTRLQLDQAVSCQGALCAQLKVELVCVNPTGAPIAIPTDIIKSLLSI